MVPLALAPPPGLPTTKRLRRRTAPWTICCLTSSYISGTYPIFIAHFRQKGHVKSAKCFAKNATARRKKWQVIQQQKKLQIPTSNIQRSTKLQYPGKHQTPNFKLQGSLKVQASINNARLQY